MVASKFGWGGLVFLLGRFAVVAVHETAHGLTMASFGRRVERAGLKAIAIFPYAFVDTSEAWFETRRRRIAISAAGPVSDFSLGAVFALCALLLPEGVVRDIFFNLAFAAYVGGFFNLNPIIERDGYHILVDALGEPGLRRRAKQQFERRLKGQGASTDSPVLLRYSLFGLGLGRPRGLLRDRHDAALQGRLPAGDARGGRVRRDGHLVGRVLPAGRSSSSASRCGSGCEGR